MEIIIKEDIIYLFDKLWPMMHNSQEHKNNCLKNLPFIQKMFNKFGKDFDNLLFNLTHCEGIGLTIGSGLIWSVYVNEAVPFDKYTLSYSLYKDILISKKISDNNYNNACKKIKLFCARYCWEDGFGKIKKYTIEDFVREALVECSTKKSLYPRLIEPC